MRLYVTDHAVVRWLERVLHIDVEKIKDDIREQANLGTQCAKAPIGGGIVIMGPRNKAACIIQGEVVTTVLGVREIRRAPWLHELEAAE
jgi:hypothetical protein